MEISLNTISKYIINKKGKIPTNQIGYGLGTANKAFNTTDGAVTIHNTAGGTDDDTMVDSIIAGGVPRWERGLAHTYVDEDSITEIVPENVLPYAIGNKAGNTNNFSVEILDGFGYKDNQFTRAEELACCYVAYKCKQHGVKFKQLNTMLHGQYHSIMPSVNATACPAQSVLKYGTMEKARKHYEDRVSFYENGGVYSDDKTKDTKYYGKVIEDMRHDGFNVHYIVEPIIGSNGSVFTDGKIKNKKGNMKLSDLGTRIPTIYFDTIIDGKYEYIIHSLYHNNEVLFTAYRKREL